MKFVLYTILAILAILIFLLLIAVIKTLCMEKKSTSYSLSDDKERSMEYGQKLAKMIQVETESHRGIPEVEKFRGFHKVLEKEIPTVFEKLEKIENDTARFKDCEIKEIELKTIPPIPKKKIYLEKLLILKK